MNILKDMDLFVRVVHCDGLAAAGRELGMTPASVTMRIKNLEKHYQVKLLTRTTRSISLTESGRRFYEDSLQMLENISQVEHKLTSSRESISGPLRVTCTSDLGRQHIAPLIDEFIKDHPDVQPFLNLSDSVTDLTESNIDVAVRYGMSPDSQLVAQKIATGRRVLCASPDYLKRAGTPKLYTDLKDHQCLTMVQIKTPLSKWFFDTPEGEKSLVIKPARSCDCNPDYQSKGLSIGADLFIAYPDRKYVPNRTREFIKALKHYFKELGVAAGVGPTQLIASIR